jgi:hypothetical protein
MPRINDTVRNHLGAEIAALSVMLLAGAGVAVWRASRRTEPELNARTWARLVPRAPMPQALPNASTPTITQEG